MHLPASIFIFLTMAGELAWGARVWHRHADRTTMTCTAQKPLALCLYYEDDLNYSALRATPVTNGSGNTETLTHNCLGSGANFAACCNEGTGNLGGPIEMDVLITVYKANCEKR
ncbi:hypothetical protein Pst134EA_019583 [Puccinia striiformis f. sp. tritici]|nr:hypothetical protein Pst134EA_019583 [Puccinia striiformis f. sp. tritici]KAH9459430.1 hypothetical protein Pst134EA_019583 [Puccinia striiformis f. sp. tritici]KAI9610536.1 hypothetical protein H4Q26_006679 [Puccinia striiformis f. sp. tritici PST-130]